MLKGKTIIFLGSSVTYGSAAGGRSFVELLCERDGVIPVKEAVSGTTLADIRSDSYVSRMKNVSKNVKADAFVCQLSTNDAALGLPVGEIQIDGSEDFDTLTVAGAIEYIIRYAKKTWNCPVVFYTGTRFNSENYALLVDLLLKIREKYHITVIDMWNSDMNDIPEELYKKYMTDGVHPTADGYREWWLPVFEKQLDALL